MLADRDLTNREHFEYALYPWSKGLKQNFVWISQDVLEFVLLFPDGDVCIPTCVMVTVIYCLTPHYLLADWLWFMSSSIF